MTMRAQSRIYLDKPKANKIADLVDRLVLFYGSRNALRQKFKICQDTLDRLDLGEITLDQASKIHAAFLVMMEEKKQKESEYVDQLMDKFAIL